MKVKQLSEGMEVTLGAKVAKAVIFDRHYRSSKEVAEVQSELETFAEVAHIHQRKEIENYLLVGPALNSVILQLLAEQNLRTNGHLQSSQNVGEILEKLKDPMKYNVQAQYLARHSEFEKRLKSGIDQATLNEAVMAEFDATWRDPVSRPSIVPGKEVFSLLNKYLQSTDRVNISGPAVVTAMMLSDIPCDLRAALTRLDDFRSIQTSSE